MRVRLLSFGRTPRRRAASLVPRQTARALTWTLQPQPRCCC